VIVAVPGPTPVTTPAVDTVASAVLFELHVITRPVSTLPLASFVVATSVVVAPTVTLEVVGATVTVATGTGVTVTVLVPACPSLVAVIVAFPGPTAVTTPSIVTVATAVLLDPQPMTRPVSTFPFASLRVAVRITPWPTVRLLLGGATVTVATGAGITVTVAVVDLPSLVAVIVDGPGAMPVTTPLDETVANAGALDDHVTRRPVSTLPFASLTVGTSVTVCPTVMVGAEGTTLIVATGAGVTVTVLEPDCPSLVAVIVTPAVVATPVTTPVLDTVASVTLLELQAIVRPVSTLPPASFNVAVSGVVWPTATLAVGGATATVATGASDTFTVPVPDAAPLVAVIVTPVPGETPVTTPLLETVATAVLLDDHVTARPVRTFPFASLTVALSDAVCSTFTLVTGGDTVTDAAGTALTVTNAVSALPSLVAMTSEVPGETAVTTLDAPGVDTVATAGVPDVHVTTRPVSTNPFASLSVETIVTV
jgi:hypothetical protein